MSKVSADTLKSLDSTQDLTIGTTGQTVTLPGNDLRVNTFKDKGGNTLWTSDGSGTLSSVNSGLKGSFILIQTQAISSAVANITFTTLDSTYDAYVFKFIAMHPSVDGQEFRFQVNASGQSGYDETITSTAFLAIMTESGTNGSLGYAGGQAQAEGTSFQPLMYQVGADADKSGSGELHIVNPSSTTYVKNWYSTCNNVNGDATPYQANAFMGGFVNITAAITVVQFKCPSGNFDGKIKMYGVL